MAQVTIKPGTDIPKLKKELKKRGFILRVYKQPDGSERYTMHRHTYRPAQPIEDFTGVKELLNL